MVMQNGRMKCGQRFSKLVMRWLKDRILTVTWAELRKNDGDQEKVKSIYIGNLPHTVTEEKLKDMFKAYGEVERIVLPLGTDGHKYREYGFVHYTDRAWALKAIEAAGQERPVLDGRELSVALAKPPVVSEPRAPGLDSRGRVPASAGSRGPGGRNRPLARAGHRGMGGGYPDAFEGYGGYGGYGGGEYGGGGFGGYAAAGGYEMGGVSLVPMYLPNGQVGFVFQQQQQQQQQHLQQQHQQRLGPAAPSSGGPIRKGAGQHSHSGGHRGERGSGDYAGSSYGSYGSYGSQRNQRGPGRPSGGSYGSYGGSSRGSGGSSRYRPY
ncbi:unnamed protein product [Ostreobium quekettii]|uniref:RRM domain-containing protein n=1 Tax=Ostreobium quekettii TaxID=121088 RepID=A0A8S1ITQ1_9CHLO|nr:unnamed protein product [Ostreobium quekettii]